ncbi:uncharacterized protein LOC131858917 [Cryptomeria japonica]|uniref:uncharacterized protein LOC131858917 n=1 Tax=Cryptomeria japonica TaxID=3369 RepID=UPI0027D9F4EA|nr:uncharacterized protein LOC131858917 [Cryptomeria japonica]
MAPGQLGDQGLAQGCGGIEAAQWRRAGGWRHAGGAWAARGLQAGGWRCWAARRGLPLAAVAAGLRTGGIKTKKCDGITTCYRCTLEKNGHRLSKWNNMDPDQQPICLQRLSQIEDMLIARVSPVLQVTYARGGQLKYSGHTICFPQDITTIASYLPRRVHELDIIIVNRESIGQQKYNFYVIRDRVHEALKYKIINEPYYKDVKLDELALTSLPITSTDISDLLYATTSTTDPRDAKFTQSDIIEDDTLHENMESQSSFVANIPPALREVEEVFSLLQLGKGRPTPTLNWPPISPSPINEYTIEGLFAMTFPTVFPKGSAIFKQQCIKEVKLHEYALHLLRYHDNRFGKHPRFRYFILNIRMRHRSQATSSIFFQIQQDDSLPTTISDLCQSLKDLPDDKLVDQLMQFTSSIRGTRLFWNKRRGELSDMVIQIGCPTLFFTLSAEDTKWSNLHSIMSSNAPTNPYAASRWRIQNIVQTPHITAIYMHHRFTTFREEVFEKLLGAKDYWYEWQHRGSAHIHGFIWLHEAPNFEKLQWNNIQSVQNALDYIDRYVSAWNPKNIELRNIMIHRSPIA